MLRSQSKCTQNVIGRYIGGKMIQSPQFTQDVPTGFQVTSPPVTTTGLILLAAMLVSLLKAMLTFVTTLALYLLMALALLALLAMALVTTVPIRVQTIPRIPNAVLLSLFHLTTLSLTTLS